MTHAPPIPQMLVLLAAAVVVVALFKRLRLSAVLGYLVAGAIIGPYGFGLIQDVEETATIAELGVVFLLFVIGTELSFRRMRSMRLQVFGVGGAQIVLSAGLIGLVTHLLGAPIEVAILAGCGLALSSTALVLQMVHENHEQSTQMGRLSLSILLMQDLAVVPLLVLVPLLARDGGSIPDALLQAGIKAAIGFGVIFVVGRIFLRPLFRSVAALEHPELFSAFTLLVVLGIGWAFNLAGLSMALGAFIAGLLVAETEFKHQVEADILPYKGLLLGLFFMVVGMSVDFNLIARDFTTVFGLVFALMAAKAAIILILCRLNRFQLGTALHTGLLLSQGGEFAFIVFKDALRYKLLTHDQTQLLMVIVASSMALTPLAYAVGKWFAKRLVPKSSDYAIENDADTLDLEKHVVIVGFGRVGQTVGKLLAAEARNYIGLELDPYIVANCRQRGKPVYYGDGTRREVLHAISYSRARAAVVTVNNIYTASKTIIALKNLAPDIPVIARTSDLSHIRRLEQAGADLVVSEMYETSLQLGGAVLRRLQVPDHEISRITELFRERDYALTRAGEITNEHSRKVTEEESDELMVKSEQTLSGKPGSLLN